MQYERHLCLSDLGSQSAIDIYALLYIYRSAKFGVVVFKACMLNWYGAIYHEYMCIVLYIYIYIYIYIYRSAIKYVKFGVAVFKASMLDWLGGNLPWVYVHCSVSETWSGQFIWKYELICHVHVHVIWFTASDNFRVLYLKIWVSVCNS